MTAACRQLCSSVGRKHCWVPLACGLSQGQLQVFRWRPPIPKRHPSSHVLILSSAICSLLTPYLAQREQSGSFFLPDLPVGTPLHPQVGPPFADLPSGSTPHWTIVIAFQVVSVFLRLVSPTVQCSTLAKIIIIKQKELYSAFLKSPPPYSTKWILILTLTHHWDPVLCFKGSGYTSVLCRVE